MTLVNADTGELIEPLSRVEAERLTTRIRLRLDAIADNYSAVMPLIREAIEREAWSVLDYANVSQYVTACFGDALSQLGVEVRREVVRELTAAGMSTRAIAPVVGVSHKTVTKDRQAASGGTSVPPDPQTAGVGEGQESAPEPDDLTPVEAPEGGAAPSVAPTTEVPSDTEAPSRPTPHPPVAGLDGKTYTRKADAKPRRKPLPDSARDAGWELRKAVERIERIADDDRFATNKEQVAPHLRSHLQNAVEVCQDLLARIN